MSLTDKEQNEALVAAPKLLTLNGNDFLIEQVTHAHIYEIYDHAFSEVKKKYNPFKEVTDALAGLDVSEEIKSKLIMSAYNIKLAGEVPADEVSNYLKSVKGLAYHIWVLSRKHTKLTRTQIEELLNEDNKQDVFVELDEKSGANLILKAMKSTNFFQQASKEANTGLKPTVETTKQEVLSPTTQD